MRHTLLIALLCSWIGTVHLKPLHHFMTSSDLEQILGARGVEDIPDYEVITPVQIDHKGDYLSHDLTTVHTRARRDEHHLIRDTPAHFEFNAFGERHQMTVKPNNELLAAGFFMQIYGDNSSVLTDFNLTLCHFVGQLTSHSSNSHVAISNCRGLMGIVITENGNTFIQPLPDHLRGSDVNPSNHTHVVYKRAAPAATGGTPPPGFGGADCGVQGSIPKRTYNKAKKLREDILQGAKQMEDIPDSSGASLGGQYIVEALVIGDHDLFAKHGSNPDEVKHYIITLMNIASSLYNEYNLGFNVRLILTRIQLFTSYNAQVNQGLYINQDSQQTLDHFSKWHAKSKPQNSNDPLDYDHAFLFIGRGMCFGENKDCWELGRAWIEGMCSDEYACSVNADKGLQIGFVFAHELGHNLGMLHDGGNGRCSHDDGYLMKSTTSNAQRIFLFSSCSKDYLMNYLQNGRTQCLRDLPIRWESRFGRDYYDYPGRLFSRDQQCKFSFGKQATYCYEEPEFADHQICENIWCDDKIYGVCVSTYTGGADGTPCDYPNWRGDKVCHLRRCVSKSDIYKPLLLSYGDLIRGNPGGGRSTDPTATDGPATEGPTVSSCVPNPRRPIVDGQWNSWSAFTPCGKTCGGGFRYRERQCAGPAPSNCGRDCPGKEKDLRFCNAQSCPSGTDVRLEKCRLHNKVKAGIDLVPEYNVPKEKECRLKCVSVSDVQYTFYAGEAPEGALCNNRTNDRCFFGKCEPVGCDNVYGSTTQVDRCGVCGGNGNSRRCQTLGGSYRLQHQWSGYYTVVEIPAKASRITISERSPSPSITLALSYSSGASIFNGGNVIGPATQTQTAAGTLFTYNRPGSTVETINCAAQIDQPVTVSIRYDRSHGINPGVEYSYDLPKSISVKQETHGWVASRTSCSATCGKGKIYTEMRCARRSTGVEVDDSKCLGLPTPPGQFEPCDAGSCLGRTRYFWLTKKWNACSVTCGNGFEVRRIVCRNFNTTKDVDISFCRSLTRPASSRLCKQADCSSHSTPTPAIATPTPAVGDWIVGDWSKCSKTCGTGQQTRTVTCSSTTCPDPKPDTKRSCKTANCCTRDKNLKICKLLLESSCLTGCNNKVIRKFCCKTCSQQN